MAVVSVFGALITEQREAGSVAVCCVVLCVLLPYVLPRMCVHVRTCATRFVCVRDAHHIPQPHICHITCTHLTYTRLTHRTTRVYEGKHHPHPYHNHAHPPHPRPLYLYTHANNAYHNHTSLTPTSRTSTHPPTQDVQPVWLAVFASRHPVLQLAVCFVVVACAAAIIVLANVFELADNSSWVRVYVRVCVL